MKRIFFLLASLLLSSSLAYAAISPAAQQAMENGVLFMERAQLQQAIVEFNTVVKLEPQFADGYDARGSCYKLQGKYVDAIRDFDKAIVLNPDCFDAYIGRAQAYNAKGDFNKAIADYSAAIKIDPNNPAGYFNRAEAYAGKEKIDAALRDFTRTIELDSKFFPAYNERAWMYLKDNRSDLAFQDLNKSLELRPNPVAANMRGMMFLSNRQYDEAVLDFSAAIDMDHSYFDAICNLAYAHAGQGNFSAAYDDCTTAIALQPSNPLGYMARCSVDRSRRDWDALIVDCGRLLKIDDKSVYAYSNRALAYLGKDEYDNAVADSTKAIGYDADCYEAFAWRGVAYIGKKNYVKAEQELSQAIKFAPYFVAAYKERAYPRYKIADYKGSIEDCTTAIKADNSDAGSYYIRGLDYAALGKTELAVNDFNKALALDPAIISTPNIPAIPDDIKQQLANRK